MSMTPVAAARANVTADSTAAGVVAVASTTPFAKGAIAFLNGTGKATLRVKIMNVIDATHLAVRAAPETIPGITADQTPASAKPGPNYGYTDVSAYTLAAASSIAMPAQAVFDNVNADPIPMA